MAEISLQSIWDAIQQVKEQVTVEVIAHLDLKIGSVQAGLMDIQQNLGTLTGQITELQERVSSNEDAVGDMQRRLCALEKDNTYLKEKVEDLENRSRRCNLRFINVPEKAEGVDSHTPREGNFATVPVVERAHRSPTYSSSSSRPGPPRPILVKFLNFQDKMKILRLAREKENLKFGESKVHIYPDFSPGLVKKRREFDVVKRQLRAADIKYSLQYPSTLRVIVEGKPKLFRCSKEAEDFFRATPAPRSGGT
ncbi:hypothetical protein WMY93_017892 [Mugilogobius chulae]|uniref:L1 transposable element RRM domain-containing protein n=1 Tax=Mugilogobius chulae TaxID=88201 RepID=A0AAW0NIL1_9GOBI